MSLATDGSIGFFTGLAAEAWTRSRTAEDTAEEAAYLVSRLGVTGTARLLDVPCGNGRLALALAAAGHRVTAVDGSEAMLARAGGAAGCDWVLGEMGALAPALEGMAPFHGAYCFGNSLGYLDRRGTAGFLRAVGAALRPHARLVIDTEMTAESVLPNLADRLWSEIGDILMIVDHGYDVARGVLETEYRFLRGAECETRRLDHYVFGIGELTAMLGEAGLDVVALESSLLGDPFSVGDPRLLLTAIRR